MSLYTPEEKRALRILKGTALIIIILAVIFLPTKAAILVSALTVWFITRY